ncbi:MAG: hypothetical protein WB699_18460 [Bacteroidota bacterium]
MARARVPVCVFVLLMVATGVADSGRKGSDVLLVEHPEKLTVLNQYEQTATQKELREFQPFAPLMIVNEYAHLSDGYTRCVKVRLDNQLFYLLTEEGGALPGEAGVQLIRDANWIADTVRTGHSPIAIERPAGRRTTVGEGALIERFFESRGRAYIRPLADLTHYGWTDWNEVRSLRPVLVESVLPRASDSTITAIVSLKIDETNSVLEQLYRMFDAQTHRALVAPRWQINSLPGTLVCDLVDSRISYEQSARYLAKDIENALLGTGARVDLSAQRITVFLP